MSTSSSYQHAKFNNIKIIPLSISAPVVYSNSEGTQYYPDKGNAEESRTLVEADHNGRSLTEANLTKILSSLVDNVSYVIDGTKTTEYDNNYYKSLTFVLNGYYLELDDPDLLKSSTTGLYARIAVTDTGAKWFKHLKGYSSLMGGETSLPVFLGIEFTTDLTDDDTGFFQLLEDGEIPTESQFKFTSKSIQNIDGGTI